MSKVKLNPDAAVVAMIQEGLKAKDGYCPKDIIPSVG